MSRLFTSIGHSCWIQCPAPTTRTFFLKPGIFSSKLSKACRYIVITPSNSPAMKSEVCRILAPLRNAVCSEWREGKAD
jgi:hypothetical protein